MLKACDTWQTWAHCTDSEYIPKLVTKSLWHMADMGALYWFGRYSKISYKKRTFCRLPHRNAATYSYPWVKT